MSEESDNTCSNNGCGCSTTYIWLATVLIIVIMTLAIFYGK